MKLLHNTSLHLEVAPCTLDFCPKQKRELLDFRTNTHKKRKNWKVELNDRIAYTCFDLI